jgi:hypothetical protein
MLLERTEKKTVELTPQVARYAEELEKRGVSLSEIVSRCVTEIQMAEGYQAMGADDIDISAQFLPVRPEA